MQPEPQTEPLTEPLTAPQPELAGQTVGPFFNFGLCYDGSNLLVNEGTPGAVTLHGHVTDGAGEPVPDALIEIWQAGPDGAVVRAGGSLARDGEFSGFGRAETDAAGYYWFRTLEPGASPSDADPMNTAPINAAPFFAVTVFARGLLDRLFTRAYLPTETLTADSFLRGVPAARRDTMVAVRADDGSLVFDIRLQGERETVFLAFATAQDKE